MARITVAALIITNAAADHMWERHLIDTEQVREILDGRYKVIPNHGDAPYRLLGRDAQGRCIAAPIYPTDDPIVWMAVSAWYCDKEEQMILRQR